MDIIYKPNDPPIATRPEGENTLDDKHPPVVVGAAAVVGGSETLDYSKTSSSSLSDCISLDGSTWTDATNYIKFYDQRGCDFYFRTGSQSKMESTVRSDFTTDTGYIKTDKIYTSKDVQIGAIRSDGLGLKITLGGKTYIMKRVP